MRPADESHSKKSFRPFSIYWSVAGFLVLFALLSWLLLPLGANAVTDVDDRFLYMESAIAHVFATVLGLLALVVTFTLEKNIAATNTTLGSLSSEKATAPLINAILEDTKNAQPRVQRILSGVKLPAVLCLVNILAPLFAMGKYAADQRRHGCIHAKPVHAQRLSSLPSTEVGTLSCVGR